MGAAWLAILREKHPEFTWIAIEQEPEPFKRESVSNLADPSDEEAVESEVVVQAA